MLRSIVKSTTCTFFFVLLFLGFKFYNSLYCNIGTYTFTIIVLSNVSVWDPKMHYKLWLLRIYSLRAWRWLKRESKHVALEIVFYIINSCVLTDILYLICTISRVYWISPHVFRTVFPSIVRSPRLYIYLTLYVQSWAPYDERKDRPKHVEWYSIKSRNCASAWLYYGNISRCKVPWTSDVCASWPMCHPGP